MDLKNQTYIGDGVYAGFDGYYIWIWISNGVSQSEKIALEPETMLSLDKYAKENWNGKHSGTD